MKSWPLYVQKHLQKKGINVLTATKLEQLEAGKSALQR